jgi:hypothetical protein
MTGTCSEQLYGVCESFYGPEKARLACRTEAISADLCGHSAASRDRSYPPRGLTTVVAALPSRVGLAVEPYCD